MEGTLETMPSVLWDAVVVLNTGPSLFPEQVNGHLAEFLKDQYRHCKPMLLLGWSEDQVTDLGLPASLPDGTEDPGLLVATGMDEDALDDFIAAVALHRHFDRETDPPKV